MLQCLQQVYFRIQALKILRTLQHILYFDLIPRHFNPIHFIKSPVAAKELRATKGQDKGSQPWQSTW